MKFKIVLKNGLTQSLTHSPIINVLLPHAECPKCVMDFLFIRRARARAARTHNAHTPIYIFGVYFNCIEINYEFEFTARMCSLPTFIARHDEIQNKEQVEKYHKIIRRRRQISKHRLIDSSNHIRIDAEIGS